VPEVVTRVVAIPTKGEPREALVSNGYFTWGPAQGAAGVPARVLGYDATGKVVFDAQSVVPAS
jgi:hypothetical protein